MTELPKVPEEREPITLSPESIAALAKAIAAEIKAPTYVSPPAVWIDPRWAPHPSTWWTVTSSNSDKNGS